MLATEAIPLSSAFRPGQTTAADRPVTRQVRASYFDKKGKENNARLGKIYSNDDLLRFISNFYAVLLTRSIHGTYVYVCDPALRSYLKQFLPSGAEIRP